MNKKRKYLTASSIIVILMAVLFNLNSRGGICMGKEDKKQKVDYMKVEFFKTENTEKSLGTAEWKNGKVIINVTDPELEKILKSTFVTAKSVVEGDKHVFCRVELKPGTLEHLEAVALEAPGYIGIISYKEKETKPR